MLGPRGPAAASAERPTSCARPPGAGAADADGLATFHAGGSLDTLANPYLCAHGLLANAFTLLDRCARPAAAVSGLSPPWSRLPGQRHPAPSVPLRAG
jgi:hypothetical protein